MEYEIVIKKNKLGYLVYNNTLKDSIDIFPDTKDGRKRLLAYVKNRYDFDASPYVKV